jgi:hypothetical protein
MKKMLAIVLSTFLLAGISTNSFAARKKSYNPRSYKSNSYKPKTVRVKSYHRKNGVLVTPHTRSKPTKRSY